MQEFFWKIIPPYEVKVTKMAVREFFDSGGFKTRLGMADFRGIEKQALSLVGNAKNTVYSMRVGRMHPEQIALICIANVLESHIGSGHYHIYRGVLSPAGNELRQALNKANELLVERGYMTQSEIQNLNSELDAQINRAG